MGVSNGIITQADADLVTGYMILSNHIDHQAIRLEFIETLAPTEIQSSQTLDDKSLLEIVTSLDLDPIQAQSLIDEIFTRRVIEAQENGYLNDEQAEQLQNLHYYPFTPVNISETELDPYLQTIRDYYEDSPWNSLYFFQDTPCLTCREASGIDSKGIGFSPAPSPSSTDSSDNSLFEFSDTTCDFNLEEITPDLATPNPTANPSTSRFRNREQNNPSTRINLFRSACLLTQVEGHDFLLIKGDGNNTLNWLTIWNSNDLMTLLVNFESNEIFLYCGPYTHICVDPPRAVDWSYNSGLRDEVWRFP